MPSGRVIWVSKNGGMLVVQHEDGYTVVEMLGDEGAVAVADYVSGDWDANGDEPIRRGSDRYDAYFQGTWGSREDAIKAAGG